MGPRVKRHNLGLAPAPLFAVIQKNLIKALVGLTFFVIFMAVLGFWFEPELIRITTWIVDRIGFLGMALLLLVTEHWSRRFRQTYC